MLKPFKRGRPQRRFMDAIKDMLSVGVTEEDARNRMRWRKKEDDLFWRPKREQPNKAMKKKAKDQATQF